MDPAFYYKRFHNIPALKYSRDPFPRVTKGTSPPAQDSTDKNNSTSPCIQMPFQDLRKNNFQGYSFRMAPAFAPSPSKGKRFSMTYVGLIASAILRSPEKRLTLSQIYQVIEKSFPEFTLSRVGWKNTVRHNLSLHDCFVKGEISSNGKSCYWAIHPAYMARFSKGDFRKRAPRELCRIEKHTSIAHTKYYQAQSFVPTHEFGENSSPFSFPFPASQALGPAPPKSAFTPYVSSAVHCATGCLRDYKPFQYHYLLSPVNVTFSGSHQRERGYELKKPSSTSQ
ncbi:forkhead box protein I1-like [Montipora capricornis]|uniref:forkhead box protein I1-like n=1 Tax=Montipora capricornis TaxID=246305 RepID=UPI0035F1E12B